MLAFLCVRGPRYSHDDHLAIVVMVAMVMAVMLMGK
jgi:hypothetical protein